MTNQIIHDPTRGWLLLTEKWPEKPYANGHRCSGCEPYWESYDKAVSHCLSTAIDIAKEDWDAVKKLVLADVVGKCYVSPCEAIGEYPCGNCKAIVNGIIKEGGRGHIEDHHPYKVDAEFEVWEKEFENQSGNKGIVKIARLVKAKDGPITVPTGRLINKGLGGHKVEPEPTESQDELWQEIVRDCTDPDGFLDIDLARKSFRIERI